jgi:hypothetical protein
MWAMTKATVEGNPSLVAQGLQTSKKLGLTGPHLDAGPLPDYDHCGFEVAMQLVNESRKIDQNVIDHKQFNSI